MEALVQAIAAAVPRVYKVVPRSETDTMLKWAEPLEIQELRTDGHFKRVGAIGDGNCLLHSLLFLTSSTYRSHTGPMRQEIADIFRTHLMEKQELIIALAADLYAAEGGAIVVAESMDDLPIKRNELGIEIAPILARLYGYNLLAVRIDGEGKLHPVGQTYRGFNELLPTLVIHYLGGGVNFGQGEFRSGGHYEPVVYSRVLARTSSDGRRTTQKKKKGKATTKYVSLPPDTIYEFAQDAAELEPILALFRE